MCFKVNKIEIFSVRLAVHRGREREKQRRLGGLRGTTEGVTNITLGLTK